MQKIAQFVCIQRKAAANEGFARFTGHKSLGKGGGGLCPCSPTVEQPTFGGGWEGCTEKDMPNVKKTKALKQSRCTPFFPVMRTATESFHLDDVSYIT